MKKTTFYMSDLFLEIKEFAMVRNIVEFMIRMVGIDWYTTVNIAMECVMDMVNRMI